MPGNDAYQHDVLIIGGGGAGLRAAIAAVEESGRLSIAVLSKVYPMRSHTVSAEGVEGVKDWILECIRTAGPDACPPLIAGVGVGGTFEKAALLSKKALFRELGTSNPDAAIDALEQEVLGRANRLGIGPQGYGGDTTAFGVHILAYPCHITSLPVAFTIECHAHRHKEATL